MARTPVLLLLLALLTAGCAADDDDPDTDSTTSTTSGGSTFTASGSASVSVTGTGSPGNSTHNVQVLDDMYDDDQITVKRGDSVNWTHAGTHPHSVTSTLGLFDSSPSCTAATPDMCMQAGEKFEHEFDLEIGEYDYYCRIHSAMTGKVIVTN